MIRIWLTLLLISATNFSGFSQSWEFLKKEEKPVFTFTVNDTLNFPVFLVENPIDSERYFATKLQTNVCNDQICLPIEINLFWDLLGNYHHFSKEKNFNFTKFDHQYFDDSDYGKLQQILLDSLSPLRDYAVEDLLDKEAKKFSFEIDAVTRPTSALFSNVTVAGALYTVYTLWHIVNGDIKKKINLFTQENYINKNWQEYFRKSNVANYQEYFLKHIKDSEFEKYKNDVIHLLAASDDFIPHYAIDLLEPKIFDNPDEYNIILQGLSSLKPHVVTEILNSISNPNKESTKILLEFVKYPKVSPKQKEIIAKKLKYEK